MMRVIVFDTETTGLPKTIFRNGKKIKIYPKIVQLGWLTYDLANHKLLKARDVIVQLPNGERIPAESTKIHKITNEMMDTNGLPLHDVFNEFNEDLQQSDIVIAHNLEFDKNVLLQEYKRNGYINVFKVMKRHQEYCTMKSTTEFCNIIAHSRYSGEPYVKWPRLEELHKKLFGSCPQGNLHDALNDVIVCFRAFCMYELNRDIVRDVPAYAKLYKKHFPDYSIDDEIIERA